VNEIELDELSRRLGEVTVVDVRSPHEYDGSLGSPCDPRQGHIPGAVHLSLDELMGLTEAEIRSQLGVDSGAELVAYCHTGSRSAFATEIFERLGYAARNYVGSWHEWSRTDLPFETGS
jgi:thiosulfate/3-mercaptopyruvate sulfurtransferase